MAGGAKETPRQKMVGMMYLVLTALLALQVSSSILDKFVFLNNTLELALDRAQEGSKNAIASMVKEAEKDGNTPEGQKLIARANELRKRTEAMINKIQGYKDMLVTKAGDGRDPKDGKIKTPGEETKVEVLMVGAEGSKSGQGYKLKKDLDDFVKSLNDDFKDLGIAKFEDLTPSNEKNKLYANDAHNRAKDFVQASFAQTPVIAALAVLTQKQSEVVRYEQEILKKLGATDTQAGIKFDKIEAVVSPESSLLIPGEHFKAKLFLAAAASNITPSFTFSGGPVSIKDGQGIIDVPVGGKGDVSWTASISFKDPKSGKDNKFDVTGKYTVVEPSISVNSAALTALYAQCYNEVQVIESGLGAKFNPSYSASGASVVQGSEKTKVTLIPSAAGADVAFTVSSSGLSKTFNFKVIPVPKPSVFLGNSGGNPLPLEKPINMPSAMRVVVKPDEGFARLLPKEANYRVNGGTITQYRGGSSIKTSNFSGADINLGEFKAQKGDGFTVTIGGVQRAAQSGAIEEIKNLPGGGFVSFTVK